MDEGNGQPQISLPVPQARDLDKTHASHILASSAQSPSSKHSLAQKSVGLLMDHARTARKRLADSAVDCASRKHTMRSHKAQRSLNPQPAPPSFQVDNPLHLTSRDCSMLRTSLSRQREAVVPPVTSSHRIDSGYGSSDLFPAREEVKERERPDLHLCSDLDYHTTEPLSFLDEECLASFADSVKFMRADEIPSPSLSASDTDAIDEEQLVAGARRVYEGLYAIEKRCILLDTHQLTHTSIALKPRCLQASIALHRALLHEHHDLFMMAHHPAASAALRTAPARNNIPARLWKHGIHGLLEVLRSRRPQSQDQMMSFIQIAYQMMTLLLETVPDFAHVWIECLGDLARYRMAVEEDREARAQWSCVAHRWYLMAADRSPLVGRLYHHLGILQRSTIHKLRCYSKSLTCVSPFVGARESLATICHSIVRDATTTAYCDTNIEHCLVTLHAHLFLGNGGQAKVLLDPCLALWPRVDDTRLAEIGVSVALTNIASTLGFGGSHNPLYQLFQSQASGCFAKSLPLADCTAPPLLAGQDALANLHTPQAMPSVLFYRFLESILICLPHYARLDQALPFVHVMLAWLWSLVHLQRLQTNAVDSATVQAFLETEVVPWSLVTSCLNMIQDCRKLDTKDDLQINTTGDTLLDMTSPQHVVLAEDYAMRGYVWSQSYLSPSEWFQSDAEIESRVIETSETHLARRNRILWLGRMLAAKTTYLAFDASTSKFGCPQASHQPPMN